MKSNILIGLLTFIWLVLMVDIIWQGTDGKWTVEDVEKIGQLEVAKYTNQIMVVAVSEDGARLCLYEKKADWKVILETEAVIGKNGLGKAKEGDGKTPVGVFLFIEAFGILDNPGANIPYTQVNQNDYWVDDSSSRYYNQFVSTDVVEKDWDSAEHVIEYGESYYYVLATSYNIERIPGRGSAVFLHCTSLDSKVTAGCIAVPEVYMREIMKWVEPQCILIIDEQEKILSY